MGYNHDTAQTAKMPKFPNPFRRRRVREDAAPGRVRGGVRGRGRARGRARSSVYVLRAALEVVAVLAVIAGVLLGALGWGLYENPQEFTLLGGGVEGALGAALGGKEASVEAVGV